MDWQDRLILKYQADFVAIHEADIFANQQKYVKALTPYEIFQANIEAGNDKQLLIRDLVESYALKISPIAKPCCICAVGALEDVYDRYGYEVLSRTLRLIIGAWEGSQQSLGASMIKGVAKVLVTYDTDIKDDVFIDKMGNISEREIIRNARERNGGMMGFAEAILIAYNRKMHNGLALEKLYARTPRKKKSRHENTKSDAAEEVV